MAQLVINTPEPKGALHKVTIDHIKLNDKEKIIRCSLCAEEESVPGWIKNLEDFISFSSHFRDKHSH